MLIQLFQIVGERSKTLQEDIIRGKGEIYRKYEREEKIKMDVFNPNYYKKEIETWDYIACHNLNYFRGNAIKYITRAGKKDKSKEVEDLMKAIYYIEKEINLIQEMENNEKEK